MICTNCNIVDERIRRDKNCPKLGPVVGKKCPGWYFVQPWVWEMRDIKNLIPHWGNIQKQNNLITEIYLEFMQVDNSASAAKSKAERENKQKEIP